MPVESDLIFLDQSFQDCYSCVSFIGDEMIKARIANEQYKEAMLDFLAEYKGVLVIDDGIALVHAAPETGVAKTGLVFVQLTDELDFFSKSFAPVKFVIGLASTGSYQHISLMQQITQLIEHGIQHQNFTSKDELRSFIREYSNKD
ncbi:hypothetical protein CKF54_04245 [Psittacicella hinzii]|uniref:Ascorbate-specific PTS system EIIA component n=1 Tax=Psittacicella hinzii TaxID=2028575 RepID=A0A3A1Y6D3_9GAMM|nr:PTS sugar transporter subunit IIA [Psittacicella hinzii]RIY32768.1 hypothetical protein CKF54_04245 [Psittacicella hinzii]